VYTRFADKSLWRLAQSGRFEDCDDVRLRNSAQFDAIRRNSTAIL